MVPAVARRCIINTISNFPRYHASLFFCAKGDGRGFDATTGNGLSVRYDHHSGRAAEDLADNPIFSQWHLTTLKFTLFGVLFGCCFPLIALAVDLYSNAVPLSADTVAALFLTNRVQFVVALAPLVLGISYHFIGRSQAALERELARREEAEEALLHTASHDALTGLASRCRLGECLNMAFGRLRRDGGSFALYVLDLDRFKLINDLHGHAAGDHLLQAVAERLRSTIREVDVIARLGGDEFAIVAMTRGMDPAEDAARVARRLIAAAVEPVELAALHATVDLSIGIALAPADGKDAETLMRRAELAMYRAKAEGGSSFRFFETEMDERIRERALLEEDLRAAIANDDIIPFFEPQIDFASGLIVSFEMLARWRHATRGFVPPAEFIPVAEDAGLVVAMTERLMRRGCRAAATWPDNIVLAINVSPLQLRDRRLPGAVCAALAESGLAAQRLELELTESTLVTDFKLARDVLLELKAIGVRLAIDDFGTGYSSLAHLQALPFDKIKIDARFIQEMSEATDSWKIVSAVVGLGHTLGLLTVAEGVEEQGQADALRGIGCDVGQGWLFGRALPEDEVVALLADGTRCTSLEARMQPARVAVIGEE
ncbi:MAG TPA: EAL domain-containing protein [Acetobacteraceae bacterium]|nr:EAL domain-containing protein [Acetobacteraceae bacterium]